MEDPPITASLGPLVRLLRRLHSFEDSEHPLPEGLSANGIRLLREGLQGLYDHLKDVPEPDPDPGATPKWWIKEVRELGYDAEDFFDEVMQAGVGGQTAGEGAIVRRSSRLSAIFRAAGSRRKQRRRQIAEDFSQLMDRVDDARERCQSFQLAPAETDDRGHAGISRHRPDLSLDLPVSAASISDVRVGTAERLVGVEVPMKKLGKLLAFGDHNQNQLKVIPIIGSAGIGKTMVARAIYHQYGGEFQCQAFVRVSRNLDMRRLLTSILSQTKAPWTHAFSDAQDLIDGIIKHLQGKSYFIVVDDLWTSSEWDIISRAFPDGDCWSRILTTTQVEDVALACSGYESEYIFKMRPLNYGESRKLFFNNVFGPEGEGACPQEFEVVADRIIRKCSGLPLSIVNIASLLLPSKRNPAMEQWEKLESSLPSTLRTDPTSQGMKDVLILIYNKLPLQLKTCLLYLSMYPEGCTIRKVDLVKQWVAESLVGDTEYGYFDELVRRGMIQPVDTNYDGEVLSCTVNHMVMDLIRYKSIEDNFIIVVKYFESTLLLPDKVRRLSLQFGGSKSAKIPESIRMSQVRSLLFCGSSRCVPSILDYGLLRILILHIWADQDQMSFDLTRIVELFRLRYLIVECNIAINLPDKIQGLRNLETLQLDGRLSAVPSDIGNLENLRHLRLPIQDNVRDLGSLTNLQDLYLTLSTAQPVENLEVTMKYMGSILHKLNNLKSIILASADSCPVNTSSVSISCDGFNNVSPALAHLERLQLLPRICIFPSLPNWFKTLDKLCTLKIAIRELSNSDIDIVKGLPALRAFSLYIQTEPAERIVFGKAGFSALKYFKLRCIKLLLKFEADAMPNLQKLKLVFNVQEVQQHGAAPICIEHLAGLKEISAKIGGAGAAGTESALRISVSNDPKNPKINGQLVEWNLCADEDRIIATPDQAVLITEERGEILEENTEYEYKGEDGDRQPDSGNSTLLEPSTSFPQRPTDRLYGQRLLSVWSRARHTFLPRTLKAGNEGRSVENITIFSFKELVRATARFHLINKVGQGGYGPVYKGKLKDGTAVAVKVLSSQFRQGVNEFLSELIMISHISHENLVKLYGCCVEGSHRILVYSYLENYSLAQTLLGSRHSSIQFNWRTRVNICIGVAQGLAYLHDGVRPHVIHRDIKASNILLDKDLTPKISDFGLAKLLPDVVAHISTRVAGTLGYLAPEYAIRGQLTRKSDVYSFGVLLIEIVSGRCNTDTRLPYEDEILLVKTWAYYEQGQVHEIIDSSLGDDLDIDEACRFLKVGLLCTKHVTKRRPDMSTVTRMLRGEEDVESQEITKPDVIRDFRDLKLRSKATPSSLPTSVVAQSSPSSSSMGNTTRTSSTFTAISDRP
ncbi:hypothetical protein ZWY2020_023571 [Hordeum vulgare]|nr:hypothetical protein ZWY2020_023571 [Hordeum vulgare]